VTNPLVLALPDFTKSFIIEYDVSGGGIKAILIQKKKKRLLAYLSKGLKGKELTLSTHEKELLSLVMAVHKWRPLVYPSRLKHTNKALNTC
jgi:hypothetical protein